MNEKIFNTGDPVYHKNLQLYGIFEKYETNSEAYVDFGDCDFGNDGRRKISTSLLLKCNAPKEILDMIHEKTEYRPSNNDGNFNYVHQLNVFEIAKTAYEMGRKLNQK